MAIERASRNVSVMLCPEPGYSLMHIRDDVPKDQALQFFGGWMKGFYPVYEGWDKEESLGHTAYREMVDELGLALRDIDFIPFDLRDYEMEKSDPRIMYMTRAIIKPEWIGNTKRLKEGEPEIQGKLNLREGDSMDVFKLDGSLLKEGLYGNDRRMFEIYLRDGPAMEAASIKIDLRGIKFSEEIHKKTWKVKLL